MAVNAGAGSKILKNMRTKNAKSGSTSKLNYKQDTSGSIPKTNPDMYKSSGTWDQISRAGSSMWQTAKMSAEKEGRTVWGAAGQHAIRGAAWGAVGGGTIEAAQGGSFWDGAKQGAFNGAVGWTGYRMGMRATGATSKNPFAGDNRGMLSSGATMFKSLSKDGEVSKQAQAILRPMQANGINKAMMKRKKDS